MKSQRREERAQNSNFYVCRALQSLADGDDHGGRVSRDEILGRSGMRAWRKAHDGHENGDDLQLLVGAGIHGLKAFGVYGWDGWPVRDVSPEDQEAKPRHLHPWAVFILKCCIRTDQLW